MKKAAALATIALILGACSSRSGWDKATFCSDVRQAMSSPTYQQNLWDAMGRDAPVVGDDGHTAGDAAWQAYGRWGDVAGGELDQLGRDEFLRQASVFVEGWC